MLVIDLARNDEPPNVYFASHASLSSPHFDCRHRLSVGNACTAKVGRCGKPVSEDNSGTGNNWSRSDLVITKRSMLEGMSYPNCLDVGMSTAFVLCMSNNFLSSAACTCFDLELGVSKGHMWPPQRSFRCPPRSSRAVHGPAGGLQWRPP